MLLVGCVGTEVLTPFDDSGGVTEGDAGGSTAVTTIDPTGLTTATPGDDTSSDGAPSTSEAAESSTGKGDTTGSGPGSSTTEGGSESETESGTDGSSSGGDAIAPEVDAVAPNDLQSGVASMPGVSVTFNEPMNPATITTNVALAACTQTIQLSADDFATCVPMAAAPQSADGLGFFVTPAAPLSSATTYRIRVTTDASDVAGNPLAAEYTTPTGFITRYFHTIAIDGVNDFLAEESFPTSTPGHTSYVAWDDAYVYFGWDSPDVASGNDQVWTVAYLGDQSGSTSGVLYNTQQPALPFEARWHVRWRADNTFTGALEHDGADWAEPTWTINPGDVYQSGTFVELRVSVIDLQSPVYLDVALGILREQALDEASWAAVPQDAYGDGYDPDFAQYFQFDRTASSLPGAYVPLP
jgi:hypothetical protein